MIKYVYDKGQGTGKKEEVGEVLYNRGLVSAMLGVEGGAASAQIKYGKKPLTGEQVRWGLENLAIDDAAIKKLGFDGFMQPMQHHAASTTRARTARASRPGTARSGWCGRTGTTPTRQIIKPMIRSSAEKYAAEKKITTRDCAKEAG